jgi:hypothetical protein
VAAGTGAVRCRRLDRTIMMRGVAGRTMMVRSAKQITLAVG